MAYYGKRNDNKRWEENIKAGKLRYAKLKVKNEQSKDKNEQELSDMLIKNTFNSNRIDSRAKGTL